ncbi:hypothetical protein GCM10007941_01110 [Amphritea balenae]|nr:hypothetical protein GCM10007941_01110 [Amphritea balenae]
MYIQNEYDSNVKLIANLYKNHYHLLKCVGMQILQGVVYERKNTEI